MKHEGDSFWIQSIRQTSKHFLNLDHPTKLSKYLKVWFILWIVKPLVENNSKNESRTLAQTRDTLLPKLLSGEIRVDDANEILEKI